MDGLRTPQLQFTTSPVTESTQKKKESGPIEFAAQFAAQSLFAAPKLSVAQQRSVEALQSVHATPSVILI